MFAGQSRKQDYDDTSSAEFRRSRLATDGQQQAKRTTSMSARDQLRFMQSWGERRQVIRSQHQQESDSPDEIQPVQQPAQLKSKSGAAAPGSFTYVPISAWEGLPVEEVAPGNSSATDAKQGSFPPNDEEAEAPLLAELARTDQRSEESAASVQSLCGGLSGSADGQENQRQPPMLREPAEVAALLRNISRGRHHLYADDAYALRLEQDVWAELRAELERQNRADARLNDDGDCNATAPLSETIADSPNDLANQGCGNTESNQWVSGQHRKAPGKRRKSRWTVGLGSLVTSRQRPPGPPTSEDSGEPADGSRVQGTYSDTTESSSYSSDEEHFFGDEIKHKRHQQRCRWRRSRVIRTSSSAASPVSSVQQRQGSNRNSSNALSDDSISNEEETNCLEANSSVPVKRAAYRVAKGAPQKSERLDRPTRVSSKSAGNLDLSFDEDVSLGELCEAVEQLDPSGAVKIINPKSLECVQLTESHRSKASTTEKVVKSRKSPVIIFDEVSDSVVFTPQSGTPGAPAAPTTPTAPARKRNDERIRLRSQLMKKNSMKEIAIDPVPDARPSLYAKLGRPSLKMDLQRDSSIFTNSPSVDEEAKQIVTSRLSTVNGEISDTSDVEQSRRSSLKVGEVRGRRFTSGRHGRLSSTSIGAFSNRLSPPPDDHKQNRNDSNRLGTTQLSALQTKHPAEVMVAGHNTEPHFTSENEAEDAVISGQASCCSDATQPSSQRILVRRRCRQVVLIHPQMVHWDLQLHQVVAKPKPRTEVVDYRLSSSDSPNSSGIEDLQVLSRQSLPTVTSRSAVLLSDIRFKPAGSPGHHQMVHWGRLGTLQHERPAVAQVRRVKNRRWRLARADWRKGASCPVQRNVSHCTEVVDNPSLASNSDGDIRRYTCSGWRSWTLTKDSSASKRDVVADLSSHWSIDRSISSSSTASTISNSYTSKEWSDGSRDTLRVYRSNQRSRSPPQSAPVAELGDQLPKVISKRRIRAASEAKSFEEPPPVEQALDSLTRPASVERLVALHQQMLQHNQLTSSGDTDWLFAKQSQQPKCSYSHIVKYLPSVTVTVNNAVMDRQCTLMIACELTARHLRGRKVVSA